MSVILYTTGCPQCRILEGKLASAKIDHTIIEDVDTMLANGFSSAPMLVVDGQAMKFMEAMKWINEVNA